MEIKRATEKREKRDLYEALDRFESEYKPVGVLGNFWDSAPRRTKIDEAPATMEEIPFDPTLGNPEMEQAMHQGRHLSAASP